MPATFCGKTYAASVDQCLRVRILSIFQIKKHDFYRVPSEDRSRLVFLCLVTLTFDFLTPKINGFPGLLVEHFYVKFGDPSCVGF